MFEKTYELSLSPNYVRHWTYVEAIRELIQNALDSDSPFSYSIDREEEGTYTLSLMSEHSTLPTRSLLLGATTKEDATDKIGSFGEGYKIALLVLTREGHRVSVWNGDRHWRPFFQYSRKYEEEILCVEVGAMTHANRGLRFVVSGLSSDQVEEVRASCLQMQDAVGQIHSTPKGDILLDRPGKLYVGGLYICDTELTYSYNVKPEHLRLERDRKTIDGWDLKSLTCSMWFATGETEKIVELIAAETPDLEHATYSAPAIVRDACYRHFREQNPGKLIATSPAELRDLVKKGMTRYVYSGGLGNVARSSSLYAPSSGELLKEPKELLAEWWRGAKYHIHADYKESFEALLRESKDWRLK